MKKRDFQSINNKYGIMVSIALAVLTVVISMPINAFAMPLQETEVLTTDYYGNELHELISEDPVESVEYNRNDGNIQGIAPFSLDEDSIVPEFVGEATLPSNYDCRAVGIVPVIRNQSGTDTCWAHTALALSEIYAIKNNLIDKNIADLSERHLVYYAYHKQNDLLGNISGDYATTSKSDYMQSNGNVSIAAHTLASWKGAVLEEVAPLSAETTPLGTGTDIAFGKDKLHLQGYKCYSTATDAELMKKAIINNGAVAITYNASGSYFNPSHYAQYCPTKVSTNHAVALIGWDDNFAKENFSTTPPGNGAWLVRNSYGEQWGNKGYFWLSYYDESIGPNSYSISLESASNYDNIYQYDGTAFDSSMDMGVSSAKVANVYSLCANKDGKENLKAVSFYTDTTNLNYEIQIYNGNSLSSNPEGGEKLLASPIRGTVDAVGYYTVPVIAEGLTEGTQIAVVITFSTSGKNVKLPIEGARRVSSYLNSVCEGHAGESYLYENGNWIDWSKSSNNNFRIKAFTINVGGTGKPDNNSDPAPTPEPIPDTEPTPNPGLNPDYGPNEIPYEDVLKSSDYWAYNGIRYTYNKGLMTGVNEVTFAPNKKLTRAMFTTVLYRASGAPKVTFSKHFKDVTNPSAWYASAITWAYDNKIVQGYQNGCFGPEDPVTREQMVKMLYYYSQIMGADTKDGSNVSINNYPDANKISPWAIGHIKWAVSNDIITGKQKGNIYYIDPRGTATRAECATVIMRFLKKINY